MTSMLIALQYPSAIPARFVKILGNLPSGRFDALEESRRKKKIVLPNAFKKLTTESFNGIAQAENSRDAMNFFIIRNLNINSFGSISLQRTGEQCA